MGGGGGVESSIEGWGISQESTPSTVGSARNNAEKRNSVAVSPHGGGRSGCITPPPLRGGCVFRGKGYL